MIGTLLLVELLITDIKNIHINIIVKAIQSTIHSKFKNNILDVT